MKAMLVKSIVLVGFVAFGLRTVATTAQENGSADPNAEAAGQLSVADSELPRKAYDILKGRCYKCHGVKYKEPGLHILRHKYLVAERGEDRDPYIKPGDPDASKLWLVVESDDMPRDAKMPSEEKAILKRWIETGAKSWTQPRPFVDNNKVLEQILDHLQKKVDSEDRETQRYFTLTHLYNNSAVTDNDLRLYRAAFSKAINSLVGIDSRQARIIRPATIDEEETIFTINLRDFGWDIDNRWQEVLAAYPYGLEPSDEKGSRLHQDIGRMYELYDGFSYLRADWFIAKATRPPLYHVLVGIPDTLEELEEKLGVDRQDDFDSERSVRGGVFQSGVSAQNRVIDRHPTRRGPSYWISYDFKKNSGRGNIARFPLGPKDIAGEKFEDLAFEHAGSEVIFFLPNGLQAYMLANSEGDRIDAGPVDIVWDTNEVSGTPQIVNGLSCIACHQHGMRQFVDTVREGHALVNIDHQNKLQKLYRDELQDWIWQDGQKYMSSLERAVLRFLQQDEDSDKEIEEFEEPISAVAKLYDMNLGLEEAAFELGLDDPDQLKNSLGSRALRSLGLAPLSGRGTIKRSMWDALEEDGSSPFQEAAKELDLGFPENNLSPSSSDENDDDADADSDDGSSKDESADDSSNEESDDDEAADE